MPFDPTRYRELIDHLDDNSHQIWHGDADEMDAALRAARMLPDLLAALKEARPYLYFAAHHPNTKPEQDNFDVIAQVDNAIAAIEEVPNAAD